MKIYLIFVVAIYAALSCSVYVSINYFDLSRPGTISVLAFLGAMTYHVILESVIDVDDFEEKFNFSDYLSDFKYCFMAGFTAFLSISALGSGASMIHSGLYYSGAFLIIVGAIIWVIVGLERNA